MMMQLDDKPGLLSAILNQVAESSANILTINQTIPIGGIASLTLAMEILPQTAPVPQMLQQIEELPGIHYLKILGRE